MLDKLGLGILNALMRSMSRTSVSGRTTSLEWERERRLRISQKKIDELKAAESIQTLITGQTYKH